MCNAFPFATLVVHVSEADCTFQPMVAEAANRLDERLALATNRVDDV